jgi:RES domain
MSATNVLVCSECFRDQGLRLDAERIGVVDANACPNCASATGRKLSADRLDDLAHRFFVWGSLQRAAYGAAPRIQFNEHQTTSISVPSWLEADMRLIERVLHVGFFHYGPRLWMIGEVEPLKDLQHPATQATLIARILREYPERALRSPDIFYRIRKAPNSPEQPDEYDSPPIAFSGQGRLDSPGFPVMYASPDLEVCVHECRVTAEDDLYIATLAPLSELRLLDLSALLTEKATEFESLDMAVDMLFLAAAHSYPVSRQISLPAKTAGFDGLVYPSYFSLLRVGSMPFQTVYGISYRRIPELQDYERAKAIPNLAIFGRPIEEGRVEVRSINRLILHRVAYGVHFGPVGIG